VCALCGCIYDLSLKYYICTVHCVQSPLVFVLYLPFSTLQPFFASVAQRLCSFAYGTIIYLLSKILRTWLFINGKLSESLKKSLMD